MKIQLKLNGEIREVSATECKYAYYTCLRVEGIAMRTTSGNKTHIGWVDLTPHNDPSHTYSGKDIREVRYDGMRGNGHAMPSSFRFVGFMDTSTTNRST